MPCRVWPKFGRCFYKLLADKKSKAKPRRFKILGIAVGKKGRCVMDSGFGVAVLAILLAIWLTFDITTHRADTLVKNIPSVENYKLCESLGTELHSFDKVTATCKNGFNFDLIKAGV
jgi:hypothetical protein